MSINIDILIYITCFYKIQTSQVSTMSDYYHLDYYHDFASLPNFPLKNILGSNNINKSTLDLIAYNHIGST